MVDDYNYATLDKLHFDFVHKRIPTPVQPVICNIF